MLASFGHVMTNLVDINTNTIDFRMYVESKYYSNNWHSKQNNFIKIYENILFIICYYDLEKKGRVTLNFIWSTVREKSLYFRPGERKKVQPLRGYKEKKNNTFREQK